MGHVEGVGCCKWIRKHAQKLNLDGYCKVLNDGSIEVVVSADSENVINDFKRLCERGPKKAQVDGISIKSWNKPVFSGFIIKSNVPRKVNKLKEKVREQKNILEKNNKAITDLKSQRKKMKHRVQKLESRLEGIKYQLKRVKRKYKKIKNSRIWLYTSPLRKIKKLFNRLKGAGANSS